MNSGATRLGIVKCQLNLEIGLAPDNRIALPLPGYLVCTAHLIMMCHNYTYLLGNSDLSLKGSIFVRMNELEGLFGEYHSSATLGKQCLSGTKRAPFGDWQQHPNVTDV